MTAPTKATAPVHLDDDLKALCLPTIASSWERMAEEARRERRTHAEYLADLASLEVGGRRERKIERRIAEARFPILKTLDAFDFAGQAGLDKETVLELSRGGFVGSASNVVLLGPVGTGKTHLAIALGLACCQQEHRVRFTTAAELTNALVEAKREGARRTSSSSSPASTWWCSTSSATCRSTARARTCCSASSRGCTSGAASS